MPRVEITSHLAQHVDCPAGQSVDATSLREALEMIFAQHPSLRDFVMTDQQCLRPHITVFIDGEMLEARDQLDVPVSTNTEIFLMQAISGG